MTKPPAVCEPEREVHEFEQGARFCACKAKEQFFHEIEDRWEVRDAPQRSKTEPSMRAVVDEIVGDGTGVALPDLEKGTGEFRMARDAILSEDVRRLKEFEDLFGKGVTAEDLQKRLTSWERAAAAAAHESKTLRSQIGEDSRLAVELFTGLLDYNEVRNGRVVAAVKEARKATLLTLEALREQGGLG